MTRFVSGMAVGILVVVVAFLLYQRNCIAPPDTDLVDELERARAETARVEGESTRIIAEKEAEIATLTEEITLLPFFSHTSWMV